MEFISARLDFVAEIAGRFICSSGWISPHYSSSHAQLKSLVGDKNTAREEEEEEEAAAERMRRKTNRLKR